MEIFLSKLSCSSKCYAVDKISGLPIIPFASASAVYSQ